jgi:hypothetical protein
MNNKIIACFNMLLTSVSSSPSSVTCSIQEAETLSFIPADCIFLIVGAICFFAFCQQIRCC